MQKEKLCSRQVKIRSFLNIIPIFFAFARRKNLKRGKIEINSRQGHQTAANCGQKHHKTGENESGIVGFRPIVNDSGQWGSEHRRRSSAQHRKSVGVRQSIQAKVFHQNDRNYYRIPG